MSVNKTSWVNGLDSIRFILALFVLLSHIHNPYAELLKHSAHLPLHIAGVVMSHLFSGAAAVAGFFIISGFVIHYPNRHNAQFNTPRFLIRRLVRIGIPMIVISMIASHYSLFFSLPLWSLYCEIFYYIIYPLLLKIRISWTYKLYLSYVICFLFVILLVGITKGWFPPSRFNIGRSGYWPIAIIFINLPAWLLGVILAEKADAFKNNISAAYLWSMRGGAFIIGMLSVALRMHWHINYTYSLIVFALFFYKWLQAEIIWYRTHTASPFFEYLGKFSYSLYLCHLLFLPLIMHYFKLSIYTYPLYVLAPIAMSYIAYLLIEYPSHRLARMVK